MTSPHHHAKPMTAHLYAGPADGHTLRLGPGITTLMREDATYFLSAEWSFWFGRRTYIVSGFPGRPAWSKPPHPSQPPC